ncbi:hypothetical protein [Bradyrhizobium sp. ORS 111]|uniref:hypothetical protein n=1 Tax=Bradyrhizobium sp. ORS 111 TaxID=1685958 RepID=UPI00388E5F2D
MHDMASRLEKLRKDAAECALTRDLATDPIKHELYARLAKQYEVLAATVERTMKVFGESSGTFLGRKMREPEDQK